jgi:hypothetical protein
VIGLARRDDTLFFNEFFSTKNEILPRNKVPNLQIIRMQRIIATSAARDRRD